MEAREKTFNWVVPTTSGGRSLKYDMKVNTKYNLVYLDYNFLVNKTIDVDRKTVKVAFLLDPDSKPMVVINPKEGIPFFLFTSSKAKKSPSLQIKQQQLVMRIMTQFDLQEGDVAEFELESFEKMSGMMFYHMKFIRKQVSPVKSFPVPTVEETTGTMNIGISTDVETEGQV